MNLLKIQTPSLLGDLEGNAVEESRLQRRQKLLVEMADSAVAQRRFWKKVDRRGPDECWEWIGSLQEGYGVILKNTFPFRAHRVSYFFKHRNLPDDLLVCHRCDNPKCVNPGHLFLGTHKDNRRDSVEKERHTRGEKQHTHKLVEAQVNEVRLLHLQTGLNGGVIARKFGVTRQTIYKILHGILWKHVPFPEGFEPYE